MPSTQINLEQITQIASPVIEGAGYELVDLEWKRELGTWILRVFIDKPNGPHAPGQGISLDGCAEVSRDLSTVLDVSEAMPGAGAYQLEVSSPGIDRPLKRVADFSRAIGKTVKVRTLRPIGEAPGRRKFAGVLLSVTSDQVGDASGAHATLSIDVGDRTCTVPVAEIEKAHLVFDAADLGKAKHQAPNRTGQQRAGSR